MNKKGTLLDALVIGVMLFAIAIATIIGAHVYNQITPAIAAQSDSAIVDSVIANGDTGLQTFDGVFLMMYIAGILGMIVSGFVLDLHPVFYIAAVIFTAVILLITPIMANVYSEIASDDAISATADNYEITNAIMTNYPVFISLAILVFIVTLYGKGRRY